MRSIITLLFALVISAPAMAENHGIADFFGSYLGHGTEQRVVDENEQLMRERFSRVVIRPATDEEGFTIEWTTLKLVGEEAPRRAETKSYAQTFRATDKPNVFRDIASSGTGPGSDASWAVINGGTLSIVQVSVAPDGNYFVTQFDRTLSKEGLDVRFTRFENSRIVRAMQLKLFKGPAKIN